MKKLAATLLTATMFLGTSSVMVFAEGPGNDIMNFGKMKEKMQEMHPEMNVKELKEMYKSCHGTGGAEPSKNFEMMEDGMMGDKTSSILVGKILKNGFF